MYISINVDTDFELTSLIDLPKYKIIMESAGMKINKSALAREFGVDRRTIDKYLNGYQPRKTRKRRSKIDDFYPIISLLLSKESKQKFYYKRILWQYLKDQHALTCSQSHFRKYISSKPEFQSYFDRGKAKKGTSAIIRYETPPGKQAQFDWKENIKYITKDGDVLYINIGVLLSSFSRLRFYLLTISRSQQILMSFLTEAFERMGGAPQTLLVDNMKSVMDHPRTPYTKGIVNERFDHFAKDYGFQVKPCVAGKPQTKGKVETIMKLLDEIHAYQGVLDYEGLHQLVEKLCERANYSYHQGTGKIPILMFEKEKNLLNPLPKKVIRDSYKIPHKRVTVNPASMITYLSHQYSVPPEYIGKQVKLQVHDQYIHIYYNTDLIARHAISESKLNVQSDHYQTILSNAHHYEETEDWAKKNLEAIGAVYNNE